MLRGRALCAGLGALDARGRALAREHGMTLSDLCTDDATCVGQRLDALGGATDSGWDAIGDSNDGDDGDNDDDVEQHLLIDCRTRGGGTPLAARNLAAFIVASAPSLSVHDELVVSGSPAAAGCLLTSRAKPKSHSRSEWSELTSRFSGLMSRWNTSCAWHHAIAFSSWKP